MLNKYLYGKSIQEVKDAMSKEEKALMERLQNERQLNSKGDTFIMYNKMFYKNNPEVLESLKQEAFKSTEWNCFYNAMYAKTKYSTTLSVMDLYATAYISLESAWKNFLEKTEEEIAKDIKNDKVPYASFATFSCGYIKDAIAVEILKNKQIDESMEDWSLSSTKKINEISRTIQSYICMNGQVPSDEKISEITGYSLVTVRNFKNLLDFGTLNKEEKFEGVEIKRDDEIIDMLDLDTSSKKKEALMLIKENLTFDEFEIIYNYFYLGKKKGEIKEKRPKMEKLLSNAYQKLKKVPGLYSLLQEAAE